jgi:hyaluronan synthase
MPVRLLGFLRMAHASGWGTRAGAYAGGDPGAVDDTTAPDSSASLMAELESLHDMAPIDVVDRTARPAVPGAPRAEDAAGRTSGAGGLADDPAAPARDEGESAAAAAERQTIAVAERSSARHARTELPPAPARRRLNPLAAVPYGIAVVLLSLEALFYV